MSSSGSVGEVPDKYPAGTEFLNRTDSCGAPISLRNLKDSRAHFLDLNHSVPQQRQMAQQRQDANSHYTVQGTLPYLTDNNSAV